MEGGKGGWEGRQRKKEEERVRREGRREGGEEGRERKKRREEGRWGGGKGGKEEEGGGKVGRREGGEEGRWGGGKVGRREGRQERTWEGKERSEEWRGRKTRTKDDTKQPKSSDQTVHQVTSFLLTFAKLAVKRTHSNISPIFFRNSSQCGLLRT